jgi:flagellum-specific ATP synthase
MKPSNFERFKSNYYGKLYKLPLIGLSGKVSRIVGMTIEAVGPDASIGDLCGIKLKNGNTALCEMVGFSDNKTLLMPFDEINGLYVGAPVKKLDKKVSLKADQSILGHVLDGIGRPMDSSGAVFKDEIPIYSPPPNPLIRKKIEQPLSVGVRAIDGLLTLGKGQRIAIMAGSGVGKSTLLGMIARNTEADINVIGLIGERGREVREFIERDLGEEGLKKSVVLVSTSDQPALVRVKALYTATAISEYFRDKGYNVLLMVDSLTRWAMAQREIGLSIGEPPATRGYTPSVFGNLPKVLERAGNSDKGTMTAIYTVLVEADDMNDPIGDTVRGIVDGHIVLSRKMADTGHYPAIELLGSVSRLMSSVVDSAHLQAGRVVKEIISTYREAKDLIEVGAYKSGMNKKIDVAISEINSINGFLKQEVDEREDFKTIKEKLLQISKRCSV